MISAVSACCFVDLDTSVDMLLTDFKLFESTELISYLPSHVFLQRRHSFTLKKAIRLSSEILMFLSAI